MTSSSGEQGCCGHCTCEGGQGGDKDGQSRRDFLALTAGAMGAVGVASAAWPIN